MSLTSYRAALPRAMVVPVGGFIVSERGACLSRSGGDLLSHDLSRSTIGAVALNGRVRKGTGCFAHAMITKPSKECVVQVMCTLMV